LNNFDIALKIKPDNINSWYYKGLTLKFLKRTKESLECFKQILNLYPNCELAWSESGDILIIENEINAAIDHYDEYLRIKPKDVSIWLKKGDAYSLLKDYINSLICYNQALEYDPDCIQALEKKENTIFLMDEKLKLSKDYKEKVLSVLEIYTEKINKSVKTDIEFENLQENLNLLIHYYNDIFNF
jgi:tetratricopeptide (TPR) repeat protein